MRPVPVLKVEGYNKLDSDDASTSSNHYAIGLVQVHTMWKSGHTVTNGHRDSIAPFMSPASQLPHNCPMTAP